MRSNPIIEVNGKRIPENSILGCLCAENGEHGFYHNKKYIVKKTQIDRIMSQMIHTMRMTEMGNWQFLLILQLVTRKDHFLRVSGTNGNESVQLRWRLLFIRQRGKLKDSEAELQLCNDQMKAKYSKKELEEKKVSFRKRKQP